MAGPIRGGQFAPQIQQIMEAERQPIKNLEARKAKEATKIKLFNDFKSRFGGLDKVLDEFSNFRKFRELKADVGDGQNHFSVTLDKDKAEPGTYELEIQALANPASIISNGFADPEEKILGSGYVIGALNNGDTSETYISAENGSLKGIVRSINGNPKSPYQATLVKDVTDNTDKPWRVIITSKKDGSEGVKDFPEFYFLDGTQDFYIDDDRDPQNAILKLDGFEIEAEGNSIPDFLTGVNLQLKQAREGGPFVLKITEDYQKIAGKMKDLVDKMNSILEFVIKQNQIDDKTDTSTTFAGDSSLQSIEYRIRNMLHEGFPVGDPDTDEFKFMFLNQMGVEFEKTGLLKFNAEKFQNLLEKDFDSMSEAITGPYGFAPQMKVVMGTYTRAYDGLLAMKEKTMKSKIDSIDRDIEGKERRLDRKHQQLVDTFSKLEASLSNMQRQQSYLAAALPGGGGGGNIVSQLLGG